MALNLEFLTQILEFSDSKINDLRIGIMSSFGNAKKMRQIIDRQCENREQTHCFLCDNEGGCLVLNGIVYLYLGEVGMAIKELEIATQHFRSEGKTFNYIIGLTLLGLAYEESKKDHQALRELEKAYHVLTRNYLRDHGNDYEENGQRLETELQNKIRQLSTQSFLPANEDKGYLALFSIPIFGTVQAGTDGTLHINSFDVFTVVNKIELEKQVFNVYGLHGTTSTDRQITVIATRTHGWLRVHGASMNGWDLPLNQNDYVLFYRESIASHLNYVIAASRDPSGEITLIVKRFDKKNNRLLSKSNDTSDPYNPIPLDEDHQIVGIVIAVAKPDS